MVGYGDTMRFRSQKSIGFFLVYHGAQKERGGVESREETWEILVDEEATMNYQFDIDPCNKGTMQALEAEVRDRRSHIEDEAIVGQVGNITPHVGCTRNKDTKFHPIVELYWHAKTIVTQGMKQKEQELMHFQQRLDALECQ